MLRNIFYKSQLLIDRLINLGGNGMFGDQIYHDPDCYFILMNGNIFNNFFPKILINMEQNRCHWNISKLFEQFKITDIIIGYALSRVDNIWFQHTWGLDKKILVETSDFNFNNIECYFGAKLKDPINFVELCNQNLPGSGKIRRNVV